MRIWLGTVLSPMLRALDVELEFVERRNWSFRSDSQDFEYLWPTALMIAAPNHANAEQVFRYHPSLRAHAAAHDHALAALRDACRAAYEKLTRSASLLTLSVPRDEHPDARKYFAEYVVNGLRDLPSHYIWADFWRAHASEYLNLRSEPSLASSFESVLTVGDSFQREAVALRGGVKELQERIADEAGLAPVDPGLA